MKTKNRALAYAIIILILLNLIALTLFYFLRVRNADAPSATATVYDNTVTNYQEDDGQLSMNMIPTLSPDSGVTVEDIRINDEGGTEKAEPLFVGNMFPGDSAERSYLLTTEYTVEKGAKTVLYFYCKAREGSDLLLLDGLELTVVQNRQTVWSGPASGVTGDGKALKQKLYLLDGDAAGKIRHQWDVSVWVRLPEEAGNEYQNLRAVLDLYWSVGADGDIPGEDIPVIPPKTGDAFNALLWIPAAAGSLLLTVLIIIRLRKEDKGYEE